MPGLMSELLPDALAAAADIAAEAAPRPVRNDGPEAFEEDRKSVEIISTVSSFSIVEVEDALPRAARIAEEEKRARKVRITEEQPPSEAEGSPRPRSHRSETSDESSY